MLGSEALIKNVKMKLVCQGTFGGKCICKAGMLRHVPSSSEIRLGETVPE